MESWTYYYTRVSMNDQNQERQITTVKAIGAFYNSTIPEY